MKYKSFKNSMGKKVLEYFPPDIVLLDFHFILTLDKKIRIGYSYLKIENWLTDSPAGIKLLDVWDKDDIVFLKIRDLATRKINVLSHNMEYSGDYWLWCLADINSLFESIS